MKFYFVAIWIVTLDVVSGVPLFQRKWTASFYIVVADGKAEGTSVLKIEALFSSETLVPTHQTTQYHK